MMVTSVFLMRYAHFVRCRLARYPRPEWCIAIALSVEREPLAIAARRPKYNKKGTEGLKFNHSNFSLLWPASFSLTYFDIIFIFDLLSESVIPNRLTIVRGLTY